ncbi:putative G-patch domain-containing protein [Seiridium cardinale]
MSYKRTRKDFEADLQAQQSPYVLFGTPLPPFDSEVRDDGSYVPVWKQEVTDERGRKRLHGAFTGGFSAGYFNTVGSKEGWAPSTFVSSRTKRWKDGEEAKSQRPEDFMDDEDLAEKAESEKLRTANEYAGLGSTEKDEARQGGLADLFRTRGETMGVKLLKRMGWKEGQGIGPRVRRKARLEVGQNGAVHVQGDAETHLFAPENVQMIAFVKKLDRKGLGYKGESKLDHMSSSTKVKSGGSSEEDDDDGPLIRPSTLKKKKAKPIRGGIGIGILNDNGSDDDDPYEVGPRISYNRTIGGDKKKKKTLGTKSANPNLRAAPVFISKKSALSKAGKNFRRCHDGRLPLEGFVFGTTSDNTTTSTNLEATYPPPEIPPGWKSSKQKKGDSDKPAYLSTADAAKASSLDPKSRAALLGEAQLPGKSVFDFLNPDARNRIAVATGKTNLPQALGEVPAGYALSPEEKQRELLAQIPTLEKDTAIAAITRGASGTAPYADDEAKRARYRTYLEYSAGFGKASLPSKPPSQSNEDWLRELREFHSCAMIFRPMTGMMASRFTTSSSSKFLGGSSGSNTEVVSKPAPKPTDPAEDAAKMGMYGTMTRSTADFYPTRLLCKRFNVPPPAHVQPETESAAKTSTAASAAPMTFNTTRTSNTNGAAITLDELLQQAQDNSTGNEPVSMEARSTADTMTPASQPMKVQVDSSVNEAVEGRRAQEEVFKAIFGDSSDDEE